MMLRLQLLSSLSLALLLTATVTLRLTTASDFGGDDIIPLIVGGNVVEPKANPYPFFATWYKRCGGSLVAEDVVLTAAHCRSNRRKDMYFLTYDAYTDNPTIPVKRTVVTQTSHPEWKASRFYMDFMLIKLNDTALYHEDGTPTGAEIVKLNDEPSNPFVGDKLKVMGYGSLDYGAGLYPEEMNEVEVYAVSDQECDRAYGVYKPEAMVCASIKGGGKDACVGDSGAPLMDETTGTQVGVVSYGVGCARERYPGAYARVNAASNWIRHTICEITNPAFREDWCDDLPPLEKVPAPEPTPDVCFKNCDYYCCADDSCGAQDPGSCLLGVADPTLCAQLSDQNQVACPSVKCCSNANCLSGCTNALYTAAECAANDLHVCIPPTQSPTQAPTITPVPTKAPTQEPTDAPTSQPSHTPTKAPTGSPSKAPTGGPTGYPSSSPTNAPTDSPTMSPTPDPTNDPTIAPTKSPTSTPTQSDTAASSIAAAVTRFVLVNTVTNKDMGELTNGMELPIDIPLSIRAEVDNADIVESVLFEVDDEYERVEGMAPYAIAGDASGDYEAWELPAGGTHSLTAIPFYNGSGQARIGIGQTVLFTVPTVPTSTPSTSPSTSPTSTPSTSPSTSPTSIPSASPTTSPTSTPSVSPTTSPTSTPTASPTTSPVPKPNDSSSRIEGAITKFVLVNATSGEIIGDMTNGMVLPSSANLNILAEVENGETIGSVEFRIDGEWVRTEGEAPYTIAGDYKDNYYSWELPTRGLHTLTATPFEGLYASGSAMFDLTISFVVP